MQTITKPVGKIILLTVAICSIPVFLVAIIFMFLIGGGGSSGGGTVSANLTGNCSNNSETVQSFIQSATVGSICLMYPQQKSLPNPYGTDTDYLPIPSPIAGFKALLPFTTPEQTPLIANCYTTWSIHTGSGGEPCGFHGYPGQCTFWALLNWNNAAALNLSGNADQYVANARAMGITVSSAPAVGGIVVFNQGGEYDVSVGHVAIVVAINKSANTFAVSEMNWITPWMIDYRIVANTSVGTAPGAILGFLPPSSPPPTTTSADIIISGQNQQNKGQWR